MKKILTLSVILLFAMQLMATPMYSIFKNTTDFQNEYVKNALMVDLEGASYQQLLQDAPSDLIVEIPLTNNLTIKVELAENQILSDDFMVTGKTTDGEQPFNYQPGLYYKGKIVGHPNSWAAISFFDNEIIGVVSFNSGSGNFVIGHYQPDDNYAATAHIIYSDTQLLIQNNFDCHTNSINSLPQNPISPTSQSMTNSCSRPLEIYIEGDYAVYTNNNSNLTTATNFITGFFQCFSNDLRK